MQGRPAEPIFREEAAMPLIPTPPPPAGGALLHKLHDIQTDHGYLPREEMRRAAVELNVPLSRLYGAATFYSAFTFQPRGRHTMQVCQGTACHIRGGGRLLEKLENTLGIQPGDTTADQEYTLETVHCLGSCSMAPVVRLDGSMHGRLRPDRLSRILKAEAEAAALADQDREEVEE
jgi:NADH-quinone oxidoreductase subunit E